MKMKKLIIILCVLAACTKNKDAVHCYKCDFTKDGVYEDAGCMTAEQWKSITFKDSTGQHELNKKQYCR